VSAADVGHGYEVREVVLREVFARDSDALARLCQQMAERFTVGARLLAFGMGAAVTDAQHVAVEFVHPVIVGKRALPALALPNESATTSAFAAVDATRAIAAHLSVVGRAEDIAIALTHDGRDVHATLAGVERAVARGLLTIVLAGSDHPEVAGAHVFRVPSDDPFVVQEVHETIYHVLWESVHVFFEHAAPAASDAGASSFLYPFLDPREKRRDAVVAEVSASMVAKAEELIAMRRSARDDGALVETAALIRDRVQRGGKVLVFGNGGSATDAHDLAADLVAPPAGLRPVPALCLAADAAVITAVGNDVGFENVFARQVIAHGDDRDVAIAISTSGGSRNVVAAVVEARRRGILTVAFVGYGGGELARLCDRAHAVDADYVPRIQEAQAAQYHLLRRAIG